jgi:hypothetical protein
VTEHGIVRVSFFRQRWRARSPWGAPRSLSIYGLMTHADSIKGSAPHSILGRITHTSPSSHSSHTHSSHSSHMRARSITRAPQTTRSGSCVQRVRTGSTQWRRARLKSTCRGRAQGRKSALHMRRHAGGLHPTRSIRDSLHPTHSISHLTRPIGLAPSDTLHPTRSIRLAPSDWLHPTRSNRHAPSDTLAPSDTPHPTRSIRHAPFRLTSSDSHCRHTVARNVDHQHPPTHSTYTWRGGDYIATSIC